MSCGQIDIKENNDEKNKSANKEIKQILSKQIENINLDKDENEIILKQKGKKDGNFSQKDKIKRNEENISLSKKEEKKDNKDILTLKQKEIKDDGNKSFSKQEEKKEKEKEDISKLEFKKIKR